MGRKQTKKNTLKSRFFYFLFTYFSLIKDQVKLNPHRSKLPGLSGLTWKYTAFMKSTQDDIMDSVAIFFGRQKVPPWRRNETF